MAIDPVVNFGKALVSTGYDAAATTVILNVGHGQRFPSSGAFNLVWWNSTDYSDPADDPNVEIVRVTNRASDTLTITRGQENTLASTKDEDGKVYTMILAMTAKMIADLSAASAPTMHTLPLTGSGTSFDSGTDVVGATSFILDTNSGQFLGFEAAQNAGGSYSVSGHTITFYTAVPSAYNSLVLICVG